MADLSKLTPPVPQPRKKRPKSRPERIESAISGLTEGDDFKAMMKNLSPLEQEIFWQMVAELRTTGEMDLEDLWKIDYHNTAIH